MLSFRDRAGAVPFVYRRDTQSPSDLLLGSNSDAFVVISKYRCDMGERRTARTVELWLNDDPSVRARLPLYVRVAVCKPGIPGEGRTVSVSSYRPTLRAAMASYG